MSHEVRDEDQYEYAEKIYNLLAEQGSACIVVTDVQYPSGHPIEGCEFLPCPADIALEYVLEANDFFNFNIYDVYVDDREILIIDLI